MNTNFSTVVDAIRAFENGEMVVVMDDDDRENEGDLIMAAVYATPEKMAFMIRHTSGIVCAPMTAEDARRLQLNAMVANNDSPHTTAFTVSVDYRHDTTTGISAAERCSTVRALANPNSGAPDFVRPGHIFPLIAREGGVLIRSGHTEAAVDLCRLADLYPVGVISELVNDDGTVKRGPQVRSFAAEHSLKVVSVADLIAYRQRRDTLVERVGEKHVMTKVGRAVAFSFRTPFDPMQHLAIVFGDIRDGRSVPVRLQRESVLDDAFGADGSLEAALAKVSEIGRGVVVYLREGSVGVAPEPEYQPRGATKSPDEPEAHVSSERRKQDWREVGLGAQILRDLGVSSIHLLSSTERHYVGLDGFGIAIESTEKLT
ncbi:MAG: 3,4-dihydroxy-2-butanone-4-phosphate synthase [Rhizobiales bacterium]|nr:3,4-dihydroxy-2-butanone-4-phosphate synthase [Hyphomicrobiales bacterium]